MPPAAPLLSTKLYPPPARAHWVARPRLRARLNQAHPFVLVAAPAGFGKTTVLSEWIPTSSRCVAWLSLDEGDDDPVRFWTYVIAALQKLRAGLGESALTLLQSGQPLPIAEVLTTLINEVVDFPADFALVLDDYHAITAQPIHAALAFLLDHQPGNMRLIVAARADPPLPLARWRARGQLAELRAADLRFTPGEAASFLNETMGLALPADDVAALETRTEGWIAGLQLAALSLQGREDAAGFIQAFSGSHRHVLSYLIEEVLNRQPPDTLDFLLQTSILERLSGPLCEAVTGASGGQAFLEILEQANLFVVPLDDERRWFRYHHLFGEVLRARLQQAQPGAAPELHRRASAWYERNGWMPAAVSHALAAGDLDRAAGLIEGAAEETLNRGDYSAVRGWLGALPEDLLRARPHLSLLRASALVGAYQLEAAEAWLQAAEERLQTGDPAQRQMLVGTAAYLRGNIALLRQDSAAGIELTRKALRLLPDGKAFRRGRILMQLGMAHLGRGDLADGRETLAEAYQAGEASGDLGTAVVALNGLGVAQFMQGALRQAAATYRLALELAARRGVSQMPFVGLAHAHLAEVLYEWNDLQAVAPHMRAALERGERGSALRVLIQSYQVQAQLLHAQGDPAAGLDAIQKAQALVDEHKLPPAATRGLQALRVRLWLSAGRLAQAEAWAQAGNQVAHAALESLPAYDPRPRALVRLLIAQREYERAIQMLARLRQAAESQGHARAAIELLALAAVARHLNGDPAGALAALELALALGEPEGFVRIFVDEGEPLRRVLFDYGSRPGGLAPRPAQAYVDRLLAAFEGPGLAPQPPDKFPKPGQHPELHEPLRERELEILRLIARGYKNREIARELVIGQSTVKTHINHLFQKLGVASRTQALARARELGLLRG